MPGDAVAEIACALTAVLVLAAEATYWRSILSGQTRPSRSSYWVWTLVQVLTAVSFGFSGGYLGITLSVGSACGFLLNAILSIWYGEGEWRPLDSACLLVTALSALMWWATRSSVAAVYCLLVADATGAVPTLMKSWRRPEQENRVAWLLTAAASITNAFAIAGFALHTWTTLDAVFSAYYIGMNLLIAAIVCRR